MTHVISDPDVQLAAISNKIKGLALVWVPVF
jgi:hypothetical protein